MCNIAGYIGKKRAAPILIDMLKREEGFDAGFYTGIATLHEGKIYYAKVVGDVDVLLRETNAYDLPGNIGIIHSRTPGGRITGGSREWAHPFVAERGGEVYLAHVSNGGAGFFKNKNDTFAIANELIAKGYTMKSREKTPVQMHVGMRDGTSMHISDLGTQYAAMLLDKGMELADAAEGLLEGINMEDVDLYISTRCPGKIAFAKVNQPMAVAFDNEGAYLATSAMAFPDGLGEPTHLPSFTSGYVECDSITVRPFKKPICSVTPFDTKLLVRAYGIIKKALETEKQTVDSLRKIISPEVCEGDVTPLSLTVYEVLRALKNEGVLKQENVRIPGRIEGLTAPLTYWWIGES